MEKQSEGKAEKVLREVGKKIDELFEKSNISQEGIKEDIKKGFEDIKDAGNKLESEFKSLFSDKDEKWSEVQSHLEKAANELKAAVEKVFKNRT